MLACDVHIIESGGQRLAILGVLGEEFATADIEVLPPKQAALETLKSVAGKYDRAIVLAYLREAELREVAAALPEVDVVVGGPTGQSLVPQAVGHVTVAAVTNKGKFVAVLNLPPLGTTQRCGGHLEELTEKWPDDPRQQENLKSFYEVLAQRQLTPGETSFVEPLPPNCAARFSYRGDTKVVLNVISPTATTKRKAICCRKIGPTPVMLGRGKRCNQRGRKSTRTANSVTPPAMAFLADL